MEFATLDDLEARWGRTLSSDEMTRAVILLSDASRMLRRRVPTIDDDIAAGTYDAEDATVAVVAMVKRAMLNEAQEGVDQFSETAGPFAQSFRFTNPNGNLFITANDLFAWFGIPARGGVQTVWAS